MTETLYFAGGVAKVPSLEEISSLPGRIENLENEKAVKVALYRGCVDDLDRPPGEGPLPGAGAHGQG